MRSPVTYTFLEGLHLCPDHEPAEPYVIAYMFRESAYAFYGWEYICVILVAYMFRESEYMFAIRVYHLNWQFDVYLDYHFLEHQYGHVVDSFTPNKRSKAGKRFGFVRFINVFNEERLVNNLCTVWIGRYRLHANLARLQRTPVSGVKNLVKDEGGKKGSSNHMNKKVNEDKYVKFSTSSGNSFVQAVKGDNLSGGGETEFFPAVVLDDECLVTKDLSKLLLGRVKEFACLANLKVALCTEGVGSWFSCIKQASMDFVTEGRIAWVETEGIPFKLWSNNTFKRIANTWGLLLDIDDQEETCYHSKRICIHMKSGRSILENFKIIHRGKVYWVRVSETPGWVPDFADESDDKDQEDDTFKDEGSNDHDSCSGGRESEMEEVSKILFEDDGLVKSDMEEGDMDEHKNKSEDPFQIYPLLEKKNNSATKGNISVGSLKYPPGFTPRESSDVDSMHVEGNRNVNVEEVRANLVGVVNDGSSSNRFNRNSKEDNVESVVSGHFKKSTISRTGGSILGILDEMVKVGQVMGYNMDGCKSNMADIIGSQRVEERYLSDHRPILLREFHVDYGPTPFRFFHYWLEMEGFCKVVEDGWKESLCDSSNAMRNLLGKLKHLKKVIRVWKKTNTINVNNIKAQHKIALEAVDSCIDKGVMANGIWVDNPNKVKSEFCEHFSKRFCKPGFRSTMLQMRFPRCISLDQQWDMECEVTNDEIKKAVWDCGTDKAPGPDGFTFGFYRRFWYLIDNDVYEAVRYFFVYGDILKGCNSSFIALIPKIPDPNMVKDFRSISLVGSLYKIIAKILANRLVGVLGVIVSEVQSAFIADRQILDGPFILNEVLQWCKACLKSSRGSIIINGSPTEEFQLGKGLKQGDPLSLFLFILIMETLHLSFQRVVNAGMFHGLQLGGLVNLSHMFYADDAVFVGQWSESNINYLVHVLECFNLVSGLKINMRKSKIMGVHVNRDKVNRAAMKLGCLVLKASFLYLGVLRSLESLRSRFFNGHDTNSRKASWVKWKTVLASKERGGLDVLSLYALNIGLLFKWIWRFYRQDSYLWTRVIKAIHGADGKVDVIRRADSFRRIPRGGAEQQQFNEMVDLVNSISIAPMSDRLVWELESSGEFTVASVRKLIDDIWLPRFNISRRGICIDSIRCVFCDKGVKTSNHLFFSCCLVRQVSRLIMRWWDVPEAEFESYEGWLSWLVNLRLPHKNKLLLEGVFYVMWWLLWIVCNKTIFETKVPLKVTFFDDVVCVETTMITNNIKLFLRHINNKISTCNIVTDHSFEEHVKMTSPRTYVYLSFILHVMFLLANPAFSDEEDDLLQGINSYRQSKNLTALTKHDNAGCMADEIAEALEHKSCATMAGPSLVTSTQPRYADYPSIVKKCNIDVNTTADGVILPVCVRKRVPTLVLTNYTQSSYAGYLNSSRYSGIGVGKEDDWVVVVLTTNTPAGTFSNMAPRRLIGSVFFMLVWFGFW
uniref:RNA-directed DNA polymerase, eukaryota n=1 Tax=Tanacetum cinerariifolium TaxID=118510 RepID=A0A699H647_TANCI|nr:RNA-directed DNA polymerase, eukaryota [Tanacetum cinerariifolium]